MKGGRNGGAEGEGENERLGNGESVEQSEEVSF